MLLEYGSAGALQDRSSGRGKTTTVPYAKLGSSSAVEQRAVNAPVAGSVPASPAKIAKRLRILTNRNYPEGFEAIEWDVKHRQFFWYAEEKAAIACFPCDLQFATEKFAECGRALDVTKLPNWPLPWWRRWFRRIFS